MKAEDLIPTPHAIKFNVTREKSPTFKIGGPREECKSCRKLDKNKGACIKLTHKMNCNQSEWMRPMPFSGRLAGSMVFSIFQRPAYHELFK